MGVAAISNRGALSIRNDVFSSWSGIFPGVPGAGGLEIVMFLHDISLDSMNSGAMQIGDLWKSCARG